LRTQGDPLLTFLSLAIFPLHHLGPCTCELGPVEDAPEAFNANKAELIASQSHWGLGEGERRRVSEDSTALDASFQESQSVKDSLSWRKGAMPGDLGDDESSPRKVGIDLSALDHADFRESSIVKMAPALFRKGALSVGRVNRTTKALQVLTRAYIHTCLQYMQTLNIQTNTHELGLNAT